MQKVFQRPKYLKQAVFHYCPGCGHSIIHRLIAEVIEELGIGEKTIGVPPAGCAVLAYDYIDVDMGEAPHGRGAAVATGLKRVLPDHIVFSYQGDGDIAAIGTAETIHAANRGESISVFFINNACYGMTGGQMAPTTLLGQESTTTPGGRNEKRDAAPLDLSEILAIARGSVYIERTAVNSPRNIRKTKRAITKSFKTQMAGLGFSLVEILSPCPVNWKMTPVEATKWIDDTMVKTYPLKVIKDTVGKIDG
ncbi:MAG: 2-oxoglutarate oxidoreductase [Deltaproteobacteria bacterium]|nr:2-oxoglutarate oxidoreductase [Deltaproteobacteria bacterium]MBN2687454.1 2-oxoglutarate oxidoreductase [Deltaproteobacteria bacterium]